jgi:tetratricopeptide (TPR) repeat protein
MRSGFRSFLLAASACVAAACAGAPSIPAWFSGGIFDEIALSEEYGNFLAARYAGMAGEPVAAASFYRRAFDRSPDDPNLLERAELATLIAGDAASAAGLAAGADPQVAAQSPTAQLALVADEIATGRWRRALARLKTTSLGAINNDAAGFLTAWLVAADDPDAGLAFLAQLPPRRLLAGEQATMQGLIHMAAGRDDQALAAFEQAARLPMGSPGYLLSLRVRLTAAKGDVAGARKLVEMHVEESGVTSETDYVLALISSGQAIERPKLTIAQGSAVAVYLASAGGVARSSSELATLRHSLALHMDPQFAPSRLMLADALNEQDRTEEALVALRTIPPGTPWSAAARLQEAWLLDGLDRPAEALTAADQALAASRARDVLIGVGDLNRVNKNNARAERLYDEAIAADFAAGRQDWRVLFARASARNGAGKWKEAEADLMAALAIEPDRPELQNFLGYGWVNRGEKVKEGMELIRKAVAARPDQGYIVDSLGWAHFQLGEYDDAVEHLERAAELSPSDAEIVDHLGDAYWRSNRQTEASFEWRRALELDPDPEREAALRQKLDHGLPPPAPATFAKVDQERQ